MTDTLRSAGITAEKASELGCFLARLNREDPEVGKNLGHDLWNAIAVVKMTHREGEEMKLAEEYLQEVCKKILDMAHGEACAA